MYTAIYVRVSTINQVIDGTSLESQIELCLAKAKELNLNEDKLNIYKEMGVSGEDIERPELNRLRKDVRDGLISNVIVTHLDRLSRDLTDKLTLCREFEDEDINLIFIDAEYKKTSEGQLFFNLMSVIAHYELALIKRRTIRGRLNAVEKNKKVMPMRSAPYGYDWCEGALLINEAEACYVRLIYQWYVHDRLTVKEIGMKLFAMGAMPKRAESKNWGASSILRILTSEIYKGIYYYNRRNWNKIKGQRTKSGASKKAYSLRDEKEWISVGVPSIIDEELYELAKVQRVNNMRGTGDVKHEYLLNSLIRCGHCGRKWSATNYSGRINKATGQKVIYKCYRCPNIFPRRYGENIPKCPSHTVRAEIIEEYVWEMIMEIISDPNDYMNQLIKNNMEAILELENLAESVQSQILLKEKEINKIKIMFKREVIDEKEMEDEFILVKGVINELRMKRVQYLEQINTLKSKRSTDENNNEEVQSILAFINQRGSELGVNDKRFLVESLLNEIIVTCKEPNIQIKVVGFLSELHLGLSKDTAKEFDGPPVILNGVIQRKRGRSIM
ncbi:recombinase family protein [Paenibacillus sp. FJAT-27812]|uniref:recombinase family protein n=1 Tax=Paenibacillus sp. FJAT-27812 TaxID=1684143 RepID=UPI0006A7EBB6|nr:recombinase family protein [Paenibacillus sp. FJAT-27812]